MSLNSLPKCQSICKLTTADNLSGSYITHRSLHLWQAQHPNVAVDGRSDGLDGLGPHCRCRPILYPGMARVSDGGGGRMVGSTIK